MAGIVWSDEIEYITGLYEEGLKKFRGDGDKELYLQLYVRYLKYLIATSTPKERIEAEFKV